MLSRMQAPAPAVRAKGDGSRPLVRPAPARPGPELRRAAGGVAPPLVAPPSVRTVIGSPGAPLDPVTRSAMEARFDRDLGHVRVHTGAAAAESARQVGALAYAV